MEQTDKSILENSNLFTKKTNSHEDLSTLVQRELTFGEKLVGITFNPAKDDKVTKAKQLCADLADLLKEDHESKETTGLCNWLYEHTVCEILNAQMNVVKVLTLKY